VLAAPDNYRLLYEDGHVRLLEVSVRPGETTPIHGHPYPSVLAFDVAEVDARALLELQGAGHAPAPSVFQMTAPTCATVGPQAPHSIENKGDIPLHYYRIEFKRADGEALGARWREWYPWMQYMKNMR